MYPRYLRLPATLLSIDDNRRDQSLIREAIRRTKTLFALFTADGAESAERHFGFHPSDGRAHPPRPALVLLDYDIGLHTGAEWLFWLRVQKKMTVIPVIMYTDSAGSGHVAECYAAGATEFLRKSPTLSGIEAIIRALDFCMHLKPPRFGSLAALPEYEAAPGGMQSARQFKMREQHQRQTKMRRKFVRE